MNLSKKILAASLTLVMALSAAGAAAEETTRPTVEIGSLQALDLRNIIAAVSTGLREKENTGFFGKILKSNSLVQTDIAARGLLPNIDEVSKMEKLGKSKTEIDKYWTNRFDSELAPELTRWKNARFKKMGHFSTKMPPDLRKLYVSDKLALDGIVELFEGKQFLEEKPMSPVQRMMYGAPTLTLNLGYRPWFNLSVGRSVEVPLREAYDKDELTAIVEKALEAGPSMPVLVSFDYEVTLEPYLTQDSGSNKELTLDWKRVSYEVSNVKVELPKSPMPQKTGGQL